MGDNHDFNPYVYLVLNSEGKPVAASLTSSVSVVSDAATNGGGSIAASGLSGAGQHQGVAAYRSPHQLSQQQQQPYQNNNGVKISPTSYQQSQQQQQVPRHHQSQQQIHQQQHYQQQSQLQQRGPQYQQQQHQINGAYRQQPQQQPFTGAQQQQQQQRYSSGVIQNRGYATASQSNSLEQQQLRTQPLLHQPPILQQLSARTLPQQQQMYEQHKPLAPQQQPYQQRHAYYSAGEAAILHNIPSSLTSIHSSHSNNKITPSTDLSNLPPISTPQ